MGLFDKKYCDICGEKIGLLGNRKLADGNLCKDCASKLSPWFRDRKNETVEEIRKQLEWREQNKEKVRNFHPDRVIGEGKKVLIDSAARTFAVTSAADLEKDNPDILNLSDVTGTNLSVDESKREMFRKVGDKNVSFNPPRYEYSYDFRMTIYVSNPYFSEMEFDLNQQEVTFQENGRRFSGNVLSSSPRYRYYEEMAEEIRKALSTQPGSSAAVPQPVAPSSAPEAGNPSWTCPYCGKVNQGKFCEACGAERSM